MKLITRRSIPFEVHILFFDFSILESFIFFSKSRIFNLSISEFPFGTVVVIMFGPEYTEPHNICQRTNNRNDC